MISLFEAVKTGKVEGTGFSYDIFSAFCQALYLPVKQGTVTWKV